MDLSILNKLFDKVFVITIEHVFNENKWQINANLKPTASNRIERIKERLKGLDYEFFYGVDASKLEYDNIIIDHNGYKKVMPQNLTLGQIGCSLSHVKLYEKIANSDFDKVLILEDDCVFLPEINNIENYMNQLPNDWGMVYLGYLPEYQVKHNFNKNIAKITQNEFQIVCGTHCISINREFAKKMSIFNREGFYTADGAISEFIKQQNAVTYAIVPNLALQEGIDCMSYEIDLKEKINEY